MESSIYIFHKMRRDGGEKKKINIQRKKAAGENGKY